MKIPSKEENSAKRMISPSKYFSWKGENFKTKESKWSRERNTSSINQHILVVEWFFIQPQRITQKLRSWTYNHLMAVKNLTELKEKIRHFK